MHGLRWDVRVEYNVGLCGEGMEGERPQLWSFIAMKSRRCMLLGMGVCGLQLGSLDDVLCKKKMSNM